MKFIILISFTLFLLGCSSLKNEISFTTDIPKKNSEVSYDDVFYRFNWERSWEPLINITIGRVVNSQETIHYIETSSTTTTTTVNKRRITLEEYDAFIDFILMKGFWSAASTDHVNRIKESRVPCDPVIGCIPVLYIDGSSWEVEGVHLQKHSKIIAHSPSSGVIYDIGMKMLELSGLKNYGPVY